MNDLKNRITGHHGCAGPTELRFFIPAIRAIKRSRDRAFKGKAAAVAEGGLNPTYLSAARGTNEPLSLGGPLIAAGLADLRIQEAQARIDPCS